MASKGDITSEDYNLILSTADCNLAGTMTHDLIGVSPVLGPLANNGGPTQTRALLAGSPVIDAIPAAECVVSIDQRGVARPQNGACDVGAFEVKEPAAAAVAFEPPPLVPLLADLDGTTTPTVRADVPPGTITNGSIFGRILVENGGALTPEIAAAIGNPDVLALGVIHAVDIFVILHDGTSQTAFNHLVKVCLLGTGRFLFLDATQSPRALSELPATFEGGYTCASIPNAGTVVLVP